MSGEIFRNLSFARSRPPRSDRTEPRLIPGDAPLPFRRPGDPGTGNVSVIRDDGSAGTRGDELRPSTAPALFVGDQRPIPVVRHSAGPLRELALAVCVVLGVGAVAGAGLLLLMPASTESSGSAAPNTAAPSISPAVTAPPAAAATAAIADAHIPKAVAADHAAAALPAGPAPDSPAPARPQSSPSNPSSPTAPSASAPAAKIAKIAKIAKSPTAAIAATDVSTAPTAATPRSAPADHPSFPPRETRRPAHLRPAVRHVRVEPPREARPPEPKFHAAQSSARPSPSPPPERPIRSTRPASMPQGDQAASFDRLMNQLTGPTRPADQSLSPPAAGAPDPFAQRP